MLNAPRRASGGSPVRRHGFARAFFLAAHSNFNLGFLARADASCRFHSTQQQGLAHGALRVDCGEATFIVTHLTPFDAASRAHEARKIAAEAFAVLKGRGPRGRVAVLGDLNSPPPAAPRRAARAPNQTGPRRVSRG